MENWIGVLLAAGMGLLFVAIGVPLMKGRVPPNRFYGYRTGATLRDPQIWYPVNALTGRYLAMTGGVLLLLALIGLSARNDPRQQEMLVWISIVTLSIGVAWSTLAGWRLIKNLTRSG